MDHNEEFLREASTIIVNNTVCQEKFSTDLFDEINSNEYFICTTGNGSIDSEGIITILFCVYKYIFFKSLIICYSKMYIY